MSEKLIIITFRFLKFTSSGIDLTRTTLKTFKNQDDYAIYLSWKYDRKQMIDMAYDGKHRAERMKKWK